MKVLFVSGARFPFAEGKPEEIRIARLASALPLADRGCEVSVVLPLHFGVPETVRERMKEIRRVEVPYGWRRVETVLYRLREDGAAYYFIGCDRYFGRRQTEGYFDDGERYAYFAHAVLGLLGSGIPVPDLALGCGWCGAAFLAAHRWSRDGNRRAFRTAFLPGDVRQQGTFAPFTRGEIFVLGGEADAACLDGNWNLLRAGMLAADEVLLPSFFECAALSDPKTAFGLAGTVAEVREKIRFLSDGVDEWLSSAKLPFPYTPARVVEGKAENRARLFAEAGLLEDESALAVAVTDDLHEDGTAMLLRALPLLLLDNVRVLFCGVGEEDCVTRLSRVASRFPGRIRCRFSVLGEDRDLLLAGADLSLVFEREGAGEKVRRSLAFGTPVLTETALSSGLVVPFGEEEANGFLFLGEEELPGALRLALSVFGHRGAYRKLFRAAVRASQPDWQTCARILLGAAHPAESKKPENTEVFRLSSVR